MFGRILLFRNLVDNIPKNIGLYSVGLLFLIINQYTFDVSSMVLGLLAFLISYSSVYILNDIWDAADDRLDEYRIERKPLARGEVKTGEATVIAAVLLATGLILSAALGVIFFAFAFAMVGINALYSSPSIGEIRLKHSPVGIPLVFIMQFLKILLPWTLSTEIYNFPIFFGLGSSSFYTVFFKGYKRNKTIAECFKHSPGLSLLTVVVFSLSLCIHPQPVLQAFILIYLLIGVGIFWRSRFTDKKVIVLGSVYILLGVLILFYLMSIM
ncbi:MAG: UbiA family prenyltransferase [Candidatus Thorarchaeota archaeon]|nr:MAG: UbiA family prenyltransferase [Candidatus Thorarchaeota archaeon]